MMNYEKLPDGLIAKFTGCINYSNIKIHCSHEALEEGEEQSTCTQLTFSTIKKKEREGTTLFKVTIKCIIL